MVADILQSLANNADDADGVAQLVVTALGSGGQHYICWKTHAGEYRQRSHGLPRRLEDWLFPLDGSTRDFETLQVILSGEDTFWASDRNGEVRSEPSGTQQQMLRRALTFNGGSPSAKDKRRMSRAWELSRGDTERPRSSTLPSISPAVDHLPGPHLKADPATHSRSSSADKLRRVSIVPIAFHQRGRSWATRPRSLVYGGEDLGVLKEQPSPQGVNNTPLTPVKSAPLTSAKAPEHRCTCGYHKYGTAETNRPESTKSTKPRSTYADASVQTDPPPSPEASSTGAFNPGQQRKAEHHRRRESSYSAISTADSYNPYSYPSSKRSSFETITTQPDPGYCGPDTGGKYTGGWQQPPPPPPQQQHWEQLTNPVAMGRMQAYFRSSTYVLGAALQPQGLA
ncbi:uncharacterized protein F4812DRAFT_464743 [Daldinia caldariorum]|uniref:uncharacterized protein n=1 Tax=Daldinia caldariorum TaxID=326644 RepID=UPI002008A52B|nr:uncharacterized protein F4812DRAFT_464743 [Daldinia caldariorum]KAI1472701.1 hypothetical protein F4812DRAFT_464743 [Daldinia caldariorum]